MARTRTTDPVADYARSVAKGRTVAGRLVRLACQRHLHDLKDGPARGLRWDREAADRAIAFFGCLRLPANGELDGKPFQLEPFQQFIVGSLFGWQNADGSRRFRTAYVEQGKGNGKSPLAAGIGVYGLVADGEAAAEIYAAATKLDQAKVLFRDAVAMVNASPVLRKRLDVGIANIADHKSGSFFRPVSSEKRGLDGPRPHMGLIDELHEHPDATVVDKVRAGTKSRKQALIFEITNAGHDRTSVCWHHHQYSASVLEGRVQNDSWFAYVCHLDPCAKHREEGQGQPVEGCPDCDDWRDEGTWLKANPGLDTILPRRYLREQVQEARGMPTKEGIVKRLNFCFWTRTVTRAIPADKWDACARHAVSLRVGYDRIGTRALRQAMERELHGRPCYGALDIGATSDFTAFALLFPHDDAQEVEVANPLAGDGARRNVIRRSYTLLVWFWLPEEPVRRDERMTAQIDAWRRQGWVRTTPGNGVDYDLVLDDIQKVVAPYGLRVIAVDRGFQGAQFSTNLQKVFGEQMIATCPQGILSMNAPFREFLELVKAGRLFHEGNPVLDWMAGNTAAEERGGLIKPSKDLSTEKIDGVTAAVMALREAILLPDPVSVYEQRGVVVLGADEPTPAPVPADQPEPSAPSKEAPARAKTWGELWDDDQDGDD